MKLKILATVAVLVTIASSAVSVKAEPGIKPGTPTAQSQPTQELVIEACTQNRAETLPVPFTDVSPGHWAFKAVMSMHYCGPGPFKATMPQLQPSTQRI